MRRAALALLALLPSLAWGQAVTLNITFAQGAETQTVGADDCGITIPVTWKLNTIVLACSIEFWLTTSSCGTDRGSNAAVHEEQLNSSQTTGSFSLAASKLPLSGGVDGGSVGCGAPGLDQTFNLCGKLAYNSSFICGSGDATATDSDPPTIHYDSLPPAPPEITRVEGVDSALVVSVSVDEDTSAVIIIVTDPSGAEVARVERTTPTGTIRIGGLTNETTYTVTAQARDDAGNVSASSTAVNATPVLTCGFLCRYVNDGGTETGGCSSAGGTLLALAGALSGVGLARARRRRSR